MTTSTAPASGPSVADRAAVAALPGRIVEAWAKNDAQAFAEVFVPDGTMILPGVFVSGRDAIRDFMADAFAGPYKDSRVTGDPIGLQFYSAEVGLLLTEGGFLLGDDTTVSADNAIRASWLVTKREGSWHLAAYQNSPRDSSN
ncbi:SgcJ/EcaC family oxidoreductase [Winogradskya consettensis]|uniref:SnoaL-like domain-containing protein n=1 Tax=Winogradskya consettensis TaxID=113560 RepID=A0A919W672_9ACTN|nr:SgcJ/EcaC family oxidoreductase [Actinoplanes consettensis]GIM82473.1 hypothetical protein Aco04nite_81690 [Actinoplanes consettensis]